MKNVLVHRMSSKETRDNTESKGSSSVAFAQQKKAFPLSAFPDPLLIPGAFTDAICYHEEFLPTLILALMMMDMTSAVKVPAAQHPMLLSDTSKSASTVSDLTVKDPS